MAELFFEQRQQGEVVVQKEISTNNGEKTLEITMFPPFEERPIIIYAPDNYYSYYLLNRIMVAQEIKIIWLKEQELKPEEQIVSIALKQKPNERKCCKIKILS